MGWSVRSALLSILSSCAIACAAPSEGSHAATPGAPIAPGAPLAAAPADPAASAALDAWPFAPAPSLEEKAAQIERLRRDPGPIRTNWTPPGKTERYGHAEGFVGAPYDVVRTRLSDFGHYKDLAGPKFKKVSVVDKSRAGTDVYFQLPIMKGLVTIWYVTRFSAAQKAQGGGEVIEGHFVKGNIKGMHIAFTVRPGPDEANTVMVCDLVLSLNIPAPQSNLDEELRDACGDAVNALRRTTAPPPPP
ncbi:MAG: SRPBCC family protein [Labilithrix sp.]|nr:SRPBCC family protein [Labilithrix sp.]